MCNASFAAENALGPPNDKVEPTSEAASGSGPLNIPSLIYLGRFRRLLRSFGSNALLGRSSDYVWLLMGTTGLARPAGSDPSILIELTVVYALLRQDAPDARKCASI